MVSGFIDMRGDKIDLLKLLVGYMVDVDGFVYYVDGVFVIDVGDMIG